MPTTPNLGLYKPAHAEVNWDSLINGNWDTLDSVVASAVFSAGGSNGQLQFNNSGAFAGDSSLSFTPNTSLTLQTNNVATSGSNKTSPVLYIYGSSWMGSGGVLDGFSVQAVPASGTNPTTALSITHVSGGTGGSKISYNGNFSVDGSGNLSTKTITGLTGTITPNAAGGTTVGSASLPFSSVFVGGSATNNIRITGTSTAARVFTLPDADSNPVQPSSAGSHQFATGVSAQGVLSYAQPAFGDISGTIAAGQVASGVVTWDKLGNAVGSLTLTNGANATTFNQTSPVDWTWANTTPATSGGATSSSPSLKLVSRQFSSGADTAVTWSLQAASNPTSALTYTVTNAAENSSNVVTLTVGAHSLQIGHFITVSGVTGTFSYLNGLNGKVTSTTGTTFTFTDSSAHGTQGSAASNGTVTQTPTQQLAITASGNASGSNRLIFPAGTGFANSNEGMGGFAFAGQSDFAGFSGCGAAGGLAIYMTGGSSSTQMLSFYTRATAGSNALPSQIGGLEYGDSSAGNSTFGLSAVATNYCLNLQGGNTTNVTNPSVAIGANPSNGGLTATSGNQIGVGIGYGKGTNTNIIFKPTSGSATFQALVNKYTVNQTGGANGAVTGLQITAVETAVGGTHKLLDLFAGSTGATEIFSIDNSGVETSYTPNGAQWVFGSASELLTLSTAGTTTDTSANLLPANAIIEAVVARVTTTITTATDWKLGDATTAGRFSAANSTMTAGTTQVGLVHVDQTGSAGPRQTSAAKVRVTTTGTPGAGAIRITVFYRQFVAPTS